MKIILEGTWNQVPYDNSEQAFILDILVLTKLKNKFQLLFSYTSQGVFYSSLQKKKQVSGNILTLVSNSKDNFGGYSFFD